MDQSCYNNLFGGTVCGRDTPAFPPPPMPEEEVPILPPSDTPEELENTVVEPPPSTVPAPPSLPAPTLPVSDENEPPPNDSARARVRFLNAVTDGGPVRIALAGRLLAPRLAVGNLTGYYAVRPGFRTLTMFDARAPLPMIYLGPVPVSAGEAVTFAVVRCANGGVDLVRVDDSASYMRGTERACVRIVNLIYNCPAVDVMLTDGRVVFTDVRFKEITGFRRARAGQYDMYVVQTPAALSPVCADIETAEDLSVAIARRLPECGIQEPLASFYLNARAGATETVYLMGNWDVSRSNRVRMVENY